MPWFLRNVPAGAQLSLTPLPWVMRRCAADAAYGLASPDSDGRAAAIADLRRVAADVRRLSSDSDATVSFVGLHTAPQRAASADALVRSLDEISSWDWAGAELVVEHCDAAIPGQDFEKGFLSLDDELDAIDRSDAHVGLWLNWGRSAIELRNADAVTDQLVTGRAERTTRRFDALGLFRSRRPVWTCLGGRAPAAASARIPRPTRSWTRSTCAPP